MSISGGPMQMVLSGKTATLTFSGAPGMRTFTLPDGWTVGAGVTQTDSGYVYHYAGGNVSIDFSASPPRLPK